MSDTKKPVDAIFRKVFGQSSLTRFGPDIPPILMEIPFPDGWKIPQHFPVLQVSGHLEYDKHLLSAVVSQI